MTPEDIAKEIAAIAPLTAENADRFYDLVFAPWVKGQGLEFLEIEEGRVKARLRQDSNQQFHIGAMCGQAQMSAVDTVMSMAIATYPRHTKGTVSQNNQFLRAAIGDDLIIEATVLKMGKQIAYGETKVTFEVTGKLVMHSTSEYAF
jgi:uncharacterized protein (TIGR00369 family)